MIKETTYFYNEETGEKINYSEFDEIRNFIQDVELNWKLVTITEEYKNNKSKIIEFKYQ